MIEFKIGQKVRIVKCFYPFVNYTYLCRIIKI